MFTCKRPISITLRTPQSLFTLDLPTCVDYKSPKKSVKKRPTENCSYVLYKLTQLYVSKLCNTIEVFGKLSKNPSTGRDSD